MPNEPATRDADREKLVEEIRCVIEGRFAHHGWQVTPTIDNDVARAVLAAVESSMAPMRHPEPMSWRSESDKLCLDGWPIEVRRGPEGYALFIDGRQDGPWHHGHSHFKNLKACGEMEARARAELEGRCAQPG